MIYILNGEPLKKNFEASLADINDKALIELKVIDKKILRKKYKLFDKAFGVVIKATPKDTNE